MRPISKDLSAHVIGRNGSTLNRIRKESGASVEMYRAPNEEFDKLLTCAIDAQSYQTAIDLVDEIIKVQKTKYGTDSTKSMSKESSVENISILNQAPTSTTNYPPGFSGRFDKRSLKQSGSFSDLESYAVARSFDSPVAKESWKPVASRKNRKTPQETQEELVLEDEIDRKKEQKKPVEVKKIVPENPPAVKEAPRPKSPSKKANRVLDEFNFESVMPIPAIAPTVIDLSPVDSEGQKDMENVWQTIKGGKKMVVPEEELKKKKKKKKKTKTVLETVY
jgi:hypothetical protein